MMKKLKQAVNELVKQEYALASQQYGATFHSPHEGFAVLREEIDEADDNMNAIHVIKDIIWQRVKTDLPCKNNLDNLEINAIKAACECVQIAAMARKMRESEQ